MLRMHTEKFKVELLHNNHISRCSLNTPSFLVWGKDQFLVRYLVISIHNRGLFDTEWKFLKEHLD
jgi:hypothetical protein